MDIRTCCRCGKTFESSLRRLLCDECRAQSAPKTLSFRERQIVTLLRDEALANKEIATRLHLSEGTVKEYLNRIFRKVQAHSRLHLVQMVHQNPALLSPRTPGTPPGTTQ